MQSSSVQLTLVALSKRAHSPKMINDENVRIFNTPVKNGSTKMTWNSPFQPLHRTTEPEFNANGFEYDIFEDHQSIHNNQVANNDEYIDPDVSLNTLLNCNSLLNDPSLPPVNYNTDIPALDSLFSELNSDINFEYKGMTAGAQSEPVNLDDIERILLPQSNRRSIRQPFSSILNSFSNLPTGPFDASTETSEISPMLWDGSELSQAQQQLQQLIPITSQTQGSNIQIKVIGKRQDASSVPYNPTNNNITVKQVPYIPAPSVAKPARSYRTYGKKRYIIGPEYADFVCRLQNDIPFDSSEDDDEDEDQLFHKSSKNSNTSESDSDDEDEEDEAEENEGVKISPQELLELFEDSCSGLPGLISAFLTHRKHQIGLKGYKPRAHPSTSASAKSSPPPTLLNQDQFHRIEDQIKLHFQFLIQNLALSNEIEGGEGITLLSLKLLVQLHLHLDSICNMRNCTQTQSTTIPSTLQLQQQTSISCLNLPQPRVNPITSRLIELIPPGIKKVGIIAGFLVRPGQKQFLSLTALRADSSLKPKATNPAGPPLPLKIKFFASAQSGQLLSNAFYNILALFHDYIDPKLLETTTHVNNLSKHIDNGSVSNSNSLGDVAGGRTAKFLASEDNLLLSGLHRFGCGNWESIQNHFLPFRTSRQLAIRYKNLSSRREPQNSIKDFNERLMMPLSEIEEDLLFKGVQRFGNQFHLISQHYLPHRPATVLGKLWKAMDDARRKYKTK